MEKREPLPEGMTEGDFRNEWLEVNIKAVDAEKLQDNLSGMMDVAVGKDECVGVSWAFIDGLIVFDVLGERLALSLDAFSGVLYERIRGLQALDAAHEAAEKESSG